MEPTEAVAMGLPRYQSLDRIELRNPNWAVHAEFSNGAVSPQHVEVYEPYAPLMSMRPTATTAIYRATVEIPEHYRSGSVSMVFRPVIESAGHRWPAEHIPKGSESIDVYITLFGDVGVWAGDDRLFSDQRAPFTRSGDAGDWLPKSWRERWREEIPDYDWRIDSR